MKEDRHVIWSNYNLDYKDWKDDLEADVYKRQLLRSRILKLERHKAGLPLPEPPMGFIKEIL